MKMYKVYEMCPHCETENELDWNIEAMGYTAKCQCCGEKLMLCDECMHADDNEGMHCDWRDNGCGGICFRDKQKERI